MDSVVDWKKACKLNVALSAFLIGFGNNDFVGEIST
jgi:hypothetical protein